MKILVLSQYWYPEEGAPQRRWQWLTELLIRDGHSVIAIAPPPVYKRRLTAKQWLAQQRKALLAPNEERGPHGEVIIRSPFVPGGRSIRARALNQAVVALGTGISALRHGVLRRSRPDVVIGTVPALPTLFATRFLAMLCRIPYVIDLRDAWPELLMEMDEWGRETSGARNLAKRRSVRVGAQIVCSAFYYVYRHAGAIIVTTDGHARILNEKLGEDGPRIHIVRNVFPPSLPETGFQRRGGDGVLKVLYAGTVGRAQQLTNAIDAVAIAVDQLNIDIELRIVGDGAGWDAASQKVKELALPVTMLHHIPPRELAQHYEWADTALVHLASWESLEATVPSKTYELMELGKHITLVADGEASDLVDTLGAGLSVPAGNPHALAQAWFKLYCNRHLLSVSEESRRWVLEQREETTPKVLRLLVQEVAH